MAADTLTRGNPGPSVLLLPIDSYARRSVGFGGEYEDNEDLQHESNESGTLRADREVGIRLADGISAWDYEKHRDGWTKGVDRMVAGLSGGMSVWRVDRFSRQMYDLEMMFRRLDEAKRGGCVLISMGMVYSLDNPHHRKQLRYELIQAQGTSDATSFSSRQTLDRQRRQGLWNGAGKRIFGFPGGDMQAEPIEGYGKKKRRPQVEESVWRRERKFVVKGYEWLLNDVALAEIARRWNAEGLTGTLGNPFNKITVRQVLTRPLNCGRIVHEGEVIAMASNVEPIVDEDTFDRAMATFAGRTRGGMPDPYLGSGLIECGLCEAKLLSRPWRGTPRYVCIKERGGCGKIAIPMTEVDPALREVAVEFLSSPEHAAHLSVALARNNDVAAKLVAERDEIEENLRRLAEKLAKGFPWAAFEAATVPLERRLAQVREELTSLEDVRPEDVQAEDRALLEAEWDAGTRAEQRALLTKAMRRGVRILVGPANPGPSVGDVARHLGIHPDTASRGLRRSPRVSEATWALCAQAAQELGFHAPDLHGRLRIVVRDQPLI